MSSRSTLFPNVSALILSIALIGGIAVGLAATASAGGVTGAPHQALPPIWLVHGGHHDVHANGVVKAVDVAARKISITHQPIPQIGWPAMTMDFAVAPSVDLQAISPGTHVDFAMEQAVGGRYVIQSIGPAGQGH